jgi:hypothetical protein
LKLLEGNIGETQNGRKYMPTVHLTKDQCLEYIKISKYLTTKKQEIQLKMGK